MVKRLNQRFIEGKGGELIRTGKGNWPVYGYWRKY